MSTIDQGSPAADPAPDPGSSAGAATLQTGGTEEPPTPADTVEAGSSASAAAPGAAGSGDPAPGAGEDDTPRMPAGTVEASASTDARASSAAPASGTAAHSPPSANAAGDRPVASGSDTASAATIPAQRIVGESAEPVVEDAADAPGPQPSPHGGMGAVLRADGTTFRVWVPDAEGVSVIGGFDGGSGDGQALAHEAHGYWSAHVPGVGAGARYKFVIHTPDGQRLEKRDPYARDLTNSMGDCVVVDPAFDWGDDTSYRSPDWDDLAIYEVHVGTFNDQVEGAEPGNLEGVIRRLDYVKELGFNCIELMPTSEFAMSHSLGYNPAHIFAVEEAYGGPAGLKTLVKEAHARGIAVILDVVYNHFGPSDLDLWRFNGWAPEDWTDDQGKPQAAGGIYFYNDWRSRTPWGNTRPDYRRGEVRQFIRDNALYWLEEFRFDGLRWDATGQIRNAKGGNHPGDDLPEGWELIRWVNREVNARQPWKLLVAEDLQTNPLVTRHPDNGGAGFDSQWDAQFVHPVREALITRDDAARDMGHVAHAIRFAYDGDPIKRVIYTESHDEVMNGRARVPHDINPDNAASRASQKRSTLAGVLVFTSPGIPMIFQGQEFLEDGWFVDTDPLDWQKLERFRGIHALYRDLVHLRRDLRGVTRGLRGPFVDVHHVNHDDKVIAFHRWLDGGPGDDVVVLVNFGDRAYDAYVVGFPRGGEWKVRFNSDWEGYSDAFGNHPSWHVRADGPADDGMPCSGAVSIGAYTAVILSQDPAD